MVLAGGIVATIRGVLGTLLGIGTLGTLSIGESLFPGYSVVIVFEFLVSLALIGVGIFAIVKSADRTAGSLIRVIGIVILAIAVIDAIAAIVILGVASISSAIGSIVVLGLIGGLLFAGGTRLSQAE
jgi:hypothetical protein